MNDRPTLDEPAILAAIRRSVVSVVPEIPADAVTPDRSLADLGCNSIDRADVVTLAMEELGVTVPLSELAGSRDVGSLVALLRRYA